MSARRLTAAALAVLVSACGQGEPAPSAPAEPTPPVVERAAADATFVCDSGLSLSVAYPDARTAQVTYRDQTYVLTVAPAASGVRYVGDEVQWSSVTRDGQETAVLSRGEAEGGLVLERCARPSTGDVTPAAPSTAPALPPATPCTTGQLALTSAGGDAGAGNRVAVFSLTNTGTTSCSLTGYPTVVVQDARNRPIASVRAEQTLGSYFRQGQTPTPVDLAPRDRAFFDIAWNVVPNEAEGQTECPSVARLSVTPPGQSDALTLAQAFTPCGGRVRVSPIRPVAESEAPAS